MTTISSIHETKNILTSVQYYIDENV